MDFKKFSKFIMIVGIIIIAIGGFQYMSNLPKEFVPSSDRSLKGLLDGVGRKADVISENWTRNANRKNATKIVVGGGVVLLIGIGALYSSKKP